MQAGKSQGPFRAAVSIADDPEAIRRLERDVLGALGHHGYPEASAFAIRLALEEAVYNAFRHGHKHLPGETVRIEWAVEPRSVTIAVEDQGPGFQPESVPDPTAADRLELPHGRGLMLMRSFMTSIRYNDKGNRVTMTYDRPD